MALFSPFNTHNAVIEVCRQDSSDSKAFYSWKIKGSTFWVMHKFQLAECAFNIADSFLSQARYLANAIEFATDITPSEIQTFFDHYNCKYLQKYPNTLLIQPLDETTAQMYTNHSTYHDGDCGLDLFCLTNQTLVTGTTRAIKFGIACQANTGFWLIPRSSISKTKLRMSNSIGLIDQGYRGEICAMVDCIETGVFGDQLIEKGTRLFQIVFPDMRPIKPVITKYLSTSSRGTGGFGSTSVVNSAKPSVNSTDSTK